MTRKLDGIFEDTLVMADDVFCPRGVEYGRSTYQARVEPGMNYLLQVTATTNLPRLSRWDLFSGDTVEEVKIYTPLARLRRPRLYIFGRSVGMLERKLPLLDGDSHGAHFLDREKMQLQLTLRGLPDGLLGSGSVVMQLLEVITSQVALFVDFDTFSERLFIQKVAATMGVHERCVFVADLQSGGQRWQSGTDGRRLELVTTILVTFEISEDPPALSADVLRDVPEDSGFVIFLFWGCLKHHLFVEFLLLFALFTMVE
ncbi:unnamed protein product [Polarella glacialis]|uniref:Uncharacterized protein n=1 Tax=Polarella glacialis TaxID=89957 RepID=A0A813HQG1_POLGL|nr:unnamed protein product [Polarella glacialis]